MTEGRWSTLSDAKTLDLFMESGSIEKSMLGDHLQESLSEESEAVVEILNYTKDHLKFSERVAAF